MDDLIAIRTGKIDPSTPGATVAAKDWKYLLSARRYHCHDRFQYDCKQLLFFIDDGRANDFFGYPDEISYWREGLRLEPEAVRFAETYLRVHIARLEAEFDGRNWRDIPFDRAAELGRKYQEIDAEDRANQRPVGANQYSEGHYNTKNDIKTPPLGTSAAYALRRLRKDRPDIHARVLAGELSAHAGMIEAGFRKKRPSQKASHLEAALRAYRKLTPADQMIFWERVRLSEAAE